MPAVPADSGPLTRYPSSDAVAGRIDESGDFMSRNPRVLEARPSSILGHGIAVADATSLDLYAHLASAGFRYLAFHEFQGAARASYLYDTHF